MDTNSLQPIPESVLQMMEQRKGAQLNMRANAICISVLNFLVRWTMAPTVAFVSIGYIGYLANHCKDFWYDFFINGSIAGFASLATLILPIFFRSLRMTQLG